VLTRSSHIFDVRNVPLDPVFGAIAICLSCVGVEVEKLRFAVPNVFALRAARLFSSLETA
jgi:hypothetical protein